MNGLSTRYDAAYDAAKRKTAHLILVCLAFTFGSRGFAEPIGAEARAQACLEVLQQWYDEDTGRWSTTSWWNAANALTAIAEYTRATGQDTYQQVIVNSFDRCKYFEVIDDPEKPPWICRNFINAWYDDEGWWNLLWLDVYELTGQQRYLEMAKLTFADMTNGWDDVCGGGVYWKKPKIGKHAITNSLFMAGALRLHQHAPDTVQGHTYLEWGELAWNWIQQHKLINDRHLVENGLNTDCEIETGAFYTYNHGVIIGALIAYYQISKDDAYLQQATQIADAAIKHLTNEQGILQELKEPEITGDSAQFKGIFVRNLSRLYQITKQPRHADFILRNANSIWDSARNAKTGEIGGLWTGPFDKADAARQSSALDALNAAIVVSATPEKP